jgi:hypothetical protein
MDQIVQGLNPGGGEIFSRSPDQPWGPPGLMCNMYLVSFPERMQPEGGVDT